MHSLDRDKSYKILQSTSLSVSPNSQYPCTDPVFPTKHRLRPLPGHQGIMRLSSTSWGQDLRSSNDWCQEGNGKSRELRVIDSPWVNGTISTVLAQEWSLNHGEGISNLHIVGWPNTAKYFVGTGLLNYKGGRIQFTSCDLFDSS